MKKGKICIAILLCSSILNGCQQKPQVSSVQPMTVSKESFAEPSVYPSESADSVAEQTSAAEEPSDPETAILPNKEDFVRAADYIPDIICDLPYAAADNFTGRVIYDFQDAYLRYGTVLKLAEAQNALHEYGCSLKIWDAYRPQWAQVWLWRFCPNPVYVSNPYTGGRTHCRGNTVDVTLVDADGNEMDMPSGFDDFSSRADRDYSECTEEQKRNAELLEFVMIQAGFKPYSGEWWHYADAEDYELEPVFTPGAPMVWQPDCNEFITLRQEPSTSSVAVTTIPKGDSFVILEWHEDFAYVDYQGKYGYVLIEYIMPVQ